MHRWLSSAVVASLWGVAACGGGGATPGTDLCPDQLPQFEFVNAVRYAGVQASDVHPPSSITPSQYGTLLIPGGTGEVHKAARTRALTATFEVACGQCGGTETCDTERGRCQEDDADVVNADGTFKTCGRCDAGTICSPSTNTCSFTTRYYDALGPGQEAALALAGYKASPNTLIAMDPVRVVELCEPDPDIDGAYANGPACVGDSGAQQCCIVPQFPDCYTAPGSPQD